MADIAEPRYTPRGFRIYAEIVDSKGTQVDVVQLSSPTPHLNVNQATAVRDALTEFINQFGEETSNG